MRTITNQQLNRPYTKVVFQGKDVLETILISDKTSYFTVYKVTVTTPPQQGWKISDIEKLQDRLNLIKKFEDTTATEVILEEKEFELLISCVNDNISMMTTDPETLDFFKYLGSVPKEDINNK